MSQPTRRIRVLVVDDSAFVRKVVRDVLAPHVDIEIVGIARDGLDALEKVAELSPDVITLDLSMPLLDGVGVLQALRDLGKPTRALVLTSSESDSEAGVAALAAGAFDVVQKPTATANDKMYELSADLAAKVRAAAAAGAAGSTPVAGSGREVVMPRVPTPQQPTSADVVVVGASTGGPQAISGLLAALPGSLPTPLAVVIHMPVGYTAAFAARIARECSLRVEEAREGMLLGPGAAVVARAGMHLELHRAPGGACAALTMAPLDTAHRPSVDVLFASAARAFGERVLAVVLTGMGDDGLAGARAVREAGGRVITEAESTCVVYGMPRAVAEAGLATRVAPLFEVPAAIVEELTKR